MGVGLWVCECGPGHASCVHVHVCLCCGGHTMGLAEAIFRVNYPTNRHWQQLDLVFLYSLPNVASFART